MSVFFDLIRDMNLFNGVDSIETISNEDTKYTLYLERNRFFPKRGFILIKGRTLDAKKLSFPLEYSQALSELRNISNINK